MARQLVIFDWDQEQFTSQIYDIVVNHKLTLLGPRVVSDKGFFLAPYFTYLLLPFYLFTRLHPDALYLFLFSFQTVFFFVTYFVIHKLWNSHIAFVFLLFWTLNPLLKVYDMIPWWPITIPLGVLLVWFSLKSIYEQGRYRDWLLLGIALGFFVNMHFQFIFILFFSFIFLLVSSHKKKYGYAKLAVGVITFAFMFMPLLAFDFRHEFLNSKLFIEFFTHGLNANTADRNVWLEVFNNFLQPLIILRNMYITLAFYAGFVVVCLWLIRHKSHFSKYFYVSSLIVWIFVPIAFMMYGKRPSEYYFVFLYPFIYIVIIDFFHSLKKPLFLYALIPLLIWLTIPQFKAAYNSDGISLAEKNAAVIRLHQLTKGKTFNVSFSVPLGAHTGYDYLMKWHGIKQSGNWNDSLVQIRIPPQKNDIAVGPIGIMLPAEFKK